MADIQGLLGNPLFNIGTGLLAQSGYSPVPVSIGQALGGAMQYANQRQLEQAQLQQAREQMKQQQARSAAASQLQGLLTPANVPADGMGPIMPSPIETPQGQAQIPGILAQLAPEQVAASLMPKPAEQPRLSTAMNDYMAMNPDVPVNSEEFRQGFRQFAIDQDPSGALTQQVQLQLQLMQLEDARNQRAQEEQTIARERRGMARDTITDLSHLEEMANLNKRLQDTFLGAGKPMPDLRRGVSGAATFIQDLFGKDTTQSRQVEADFDRLSKLTTDFVINSLDRFASSGTVSVPKFNALLNSNASMGASPIANNQIIADNISTILDAAEVEGIDVPNASSLRKLANDLKATSAANTARNILSMPIQDLMNLDTNTLNDTERAQLDQRLTEAGY